MNNTMKQYAYFLIGLSFFWASTSLTNFLEYPLIALPLCLFFHCIFSANTPLLLFLAALHCIEYNLWHGTCIPALVALTIITGIAQFLKRKTLLPFIVLRMALLALFLCLEQYCALLFSHTPLPGSEQYVKTFLLSAGILVFLAFFMPERPKDRIK
jgi:hypothetical protein